MVVDTKGLICWIFKIFLLWGNFYVRLVTEYNIICFEMIYMAESCQRLMFLSTVIWKTNNRFSRMWLHYVSTNYCSVVAGVSSLCVFLLFSGHPSRSIIVILFTFYLFCCWFCVVRMISISLRSTLYFLNDVETPFKVLLISECLHERQKEAIASIWTIGIPPTSLVDSALSHDQKTIHAEKGWAEMCISLWLPWYVSYRSWDKSKNPCPCRNHTFPNSMSVALCFPGLDDALSWEMCDFCIGMGSCSSSEFGILLMPYVDALFRMLGISLTLCHFWCLHLTIWFGASFWTFDISIMPPVGASF